MCSIEGVNIFKKEIDIRVLVTVREINIRVLVTVRKLSLYEKGLKLIDSKFCSGAILIQLM